jgi:hypothetical protein
MKGQYTYFNHIEQSRNLVSVDFTPSGTCSVVGCKLSCDNGKLYDLQTVATSDGGSTQRYFQAGENSSLYTNKV